MAHHCFFRHRDLLSHHPNRLNSQSHNRRHPFFLRTSLPPPALPPRPPFPQTTTVTQSLCPAEAAFSGHRCSQAHGLLAPARRQVLPAAPPTAFPRSTVERASRPSARASLRRSDVSSGERSSARTRARWRWPRLRPSSRSSAGAFPWPLWLRRSLRSALRMRSWSRRRWRRR